MTMTNSMKEYLPDPGIELPNVRLDALPTESVRLGEIPVVPEPKVDRV